MQEVSSNTTYCRTRRRDLIYRVQFIAQIFGNTTYRRNRRRDLIYRVQFIAATTRASARHCPYLTQ